MICIDNLFSKVTLHLKSYCFIYYLQDTVKWMKLRRTNKVRSLTSSSSDGTLFSWRSDRGKRKDSAWGRGNRSNEKGKGKVPVATSSSGYGRFGMYKKETSGKDESWGNDERKRTRMDPGQRVGGFGKTEVRDGVRITAELATFYHKN